MCMSRPGRVIQVREGLAEVESAGRRAWFNSLMVPEAKAGDWVLTHTGLVLSVVTREDADAVEALMAEVDQAIAGEFAT
jgi:hydrogenase expression/formation protein HypC